MRRFLMLLFVGLGFGTAAYASQITDVEYLRDQSVFTVRLPISEPVQTDKIEVDLIRETIQINLAGVTLAEDKKLVSVEDTLVRSLYAYLPEKESFRLRIVLGKGTAAASYRDALRITQDKEALIVSVYEAAADPALKEIGEEYSYSIPLESEKPFGDELLAATLKASEPESRQTSAAESEKSKVAASTDLETSKAPSSEIVKDESKVPVFQKVSKAGKEEPTSVRGLIATVIGLILVFAASFWGLKRWQKKSGNNQQPIKIKVLTQHYLGPKKSLAIVRVAGESILIGVTDHNINMIKSLSLIDDEIPEDAPKSFAGAMDHAEAPDFAASAVTALGDERDTDNFALTGLGEIQDRISQKLQGMRHF